MGGGRLLPKGDGRVREVLRESPDTRHSNPGNGHGVSVYGSGYGLFRNDGSTEPWGS